MLARIKETQREIDTSNRRLEQSVLRRSNESHVGSTVSTKRLKVGFQSVLLSFTVEFSSEQEERHPKSNAVANTASKNVCTIRLPKWFVQDQYNLALVRSKNGWLYLPSVYRTVEDDSPFFKACRDGNLDEMKMLLTTKQAYLSDRSVLKHGTQSALVYAILNNQFGACRLLIESGILRSFESCDYAEALEKISWNWAIASKRIQGRELLHMIELDQNLDLDWIDDVDLGSDFYKVIQDLRICAEEADGSAVNRLEVLIFPTMYSVEWTILETSLHWLSDFLGDADHLREIQANESHYGWLLFALAEKIGMLFWSENRHHKHATRLCRFALTAICDTELDLHSHMYDLAGSWQHALDTVDWMGSDSAKMTPLAFLFAHWLFIYHIIGDMSRGFEPLEATLRLWVYTLHDAGVDLAAYAEHEVWLINKILMRASSTRNARCRLFHGPVPNDWRIEKGPPGEAYPACFWRNIEAAPIDEDLATKVLDLMYRVGHVDNVQRNVPGSWQIGQNELTWDVHGWLAYKKDSDMVQMELDLEQLDDEEFYEQWDLGSVIEEWPFIDWGDW